MLSDPAFVEGLCRNTREHVGIIIRWLMPDGAEPAVEDVATTIGGLLAAASEIRWGVGDILVAVDASRREAGVPKTAWRDYLRQLGPMIATMGYNTLWAYYSTALMFPEGKRIPDKSFTWHRELMHLAGRLLPRSGWTREGHEADRREKAAELLEVAADEDWSLSRVRAERLESPGRGLHFTVPLPDRVDVVDRGTGETEGFLRFAEVAPADAVRFVLGRLGVWRGSWAPVGGLSVRHHNMECGLYLGGALVATVGRGSLAQEALGRVKGRLGVER